MNSLQWFREMYKCGKLSLEMYLEILNAEINQREQDILEIKEEFSRVHCSQLVTRTRVECENPTVTLKMGAVEARWLINSFQVAQNDHCNKSSKRHAESKELVKNLTQSINKQLGVEFANEE